MFPTICVLSPITKVETTPPLVPYSSYLRVLSDPVTLGLGETIDPVPVYCDSQIIEKQRKVYPYLYLPLAYNRLTLDLISQLDYVLPSVPEVWDLGLPNPSLDRGTEEFIERIRGARRQRSVTDLDCSHLMSH